MNIYELSRKDLVKYEKEFSKTAYGQKVRLPVLISLMSIIIWLIVVIGFAVIQYNCYMWLKSSAYCSGYYGCYGYSGFGDLTTPCVISFVIIAAMCVFSAAYYNKEIRKYVQSK